MFGAILGAASIFYFLNEEEGQIKFQEAAIEQVVDSVKEEIPEPKKLYGIVVDDLNILGKKSEKEPEYL